MLLMVGKGAPRQAIKRLRSTVSQAAPPNAPYRPQPPAILGDTMEPREAGRRLPEEGGRDEPSTGVSMAVAEKDAENLFGKS